MISQNNSFAFLVASLVSVGGILYGYDMGVISGALLFIQNDIPLTRAETGQIVGAVLGGCLAGTLLAGPTGDRFGRRLLIMLAALVFIIGVSLILAASSFASLLGARLLLGTGVGVIAVAVPLYVTELVPDKNRGRYVTFFQLLLTFGIMLAYVVDWYFTGSGNWRAMFAILLIPSVILFIGMFFLPESPRWLAATSQPDRALRVLQKIYPDRMEAVRILDEIQSGIRESGGGTWGELFSRQLFLPLSAAVLIAIFNQLTGINSFLQYAPLILKNAGIATNQGSMAGSFGIGLLNFIFTLFSIALIDVLGRRRMLLTGIAGVIAAEIFLGCIHLFITNTLLAGILSLLGLLAFIIFFAMGPGVVVWLAISELFPTKVRGKGVALCLFFNSLAATMLATWFLQIVDFVGMGRTYWLFASFSLIYFVIVRALLPETKARSLEEIQKEYFISSTAVQTFAE